MSMLHGKELISFSWTNRVSSADISPIPYLTIFPPVITFVVCFLICLCSLVAYIANSMDPDQTAPKSEQGW